MKADNIGWTTGGAAKNVWNVKTLDMVQQDTIERKNLIKITPSFLSIIT